ncbi:hypothetical protein [Dactylosporangium sp. CS-033363]|uniref:hypothetical protein n=1 Tax=Dactylosporangium sp. CS-033363 TaxID=3239935 RepID=UPI003D8F078E
MGEALFSIGGMRGEAMLLAYLVGGLAVFGAAFLPGNTPLYRVVCLVLGTAMAAWAGKVLLLGGFVYVNALVMLAPLLLLIRGGIGALRSALTRPARTPLLRTHPAAARQFGDASFQPHLPAAYAAQQRQAPLAYATVHAAYPAASQNGHASQTGHALQVTQAGRSGHGAPIGALDRASWSGYVAESAEITNAAPLTTATGPIDEQSRFVVERARPAFAPHGHGEPAKHAAQPSGHIPRQTRGRGADVMNPSAGRARHRAS